MTRWRERPFLCKLGFHSRCHNWPNGDFCNHCFIDLTPLFIA